MRSIVPRVENPASSAARAQAVSSSPVVPGTAFGSPIPSSTAGLLQFICSPYRVPKPSRAACLGRRPAGGGAGREARSPRLRRRSSGPPGHLRGEWRKRVDGGGPKAQAPRGRGACAGSLVAPAPAGGADGGSLLGRLVPARLGAGAGGDARGRRRGRGRGAAGPGGAVFRVPRRGAAGAAAGAAPRPLPCLAGVCLAAGLPG